MIHEITHDTSRLSTLKAAGLGLLQTGFLPFSLDSYEILTVMGIDVLFHIKKTKQNNPKFQAA